MKLKSIFLALVFLTAFSSAFSQSKILRHVVLFKLKDSTSKADIKNMEDAFWALPTKISAIKSFEFGLNNSPESHDQGYTHCYLLTFKSEADRDIYLVHPDHKAFGKIVGPMIDKVHVVDYWALKAK